MAMDKRQSSDAYMMYEFKVKLCPRLDHHNWKHCPYRHPGEVAAQRRHPSLHKPAFCMNLKLYGSCAAGDDCPFSHNTFEMSLHPERYKTTLCTLGGNCNREICFFAHSTEDLRTPDVTAPLGAMGPETTINLTHIAEDANAAAESAASQAAAVPELLVQGDGGMQVLLQPPPPLQQQQQQSQQQQQAVQHNNNNNLQHLLMQYEGGQAAQQQQQLQLQQHARMQAVQQQLQQQQSDQQAMLLAQVQAQQQQQQMNELVLAQRQLLLANGMSSGQAMMSGLPAGQMLNSSFTGGSMQQRGGAMQQQQLVMLQDAAGAHRGESFTSQCSTSSYVSGLGVLRAAQGTLPVSPLIDRSAHSFTLTDRSQTGSLTLGSVAERPHSFSVGDRPQAAALLASLGERAPSFTLGERPASFTLLDASRANSFTLGQQSPAAALLVERSAASFTGMEGSGGLAMMEGLSVVERSSQTQRSFTLGQRPQLQGGAWYESDTAAGGVLQSPAGDGAAMYQLAQMQEQQQPQQQQQGGGRMGLGALFQWR